MAYTDDDKDMLNSIVEKDIVEILDQRLPWERFRGKRILVTGASGMIASYLVESLMHLNKAAFDDKCKIVAMVRNVEYARERFNHYDESDGLSIVHHDVSKQYVTKEKIDFIIHAASLASPKNYLKDPVGTIAANTLGNFNLLYLAEENEVESFLYVSSGAVYGKNVHNVSIRENMFGPIDPLSARSCYAEGKRAGETICNSFYHQYGVPIRIARLFHTYGPGMKLDDGRVFADFVSDVLNNRDIVVKGQGKSIRSFCYISDAISALFTILLKGTDGEAYNIGNEDNKIRIDHLASLLASDFGERGIQVNIQGSHFQEEAEEDHHWPDTGKLRSLGWNPRIDISEGFRRTVDSFSSHDSHTLSLSGGTNS